MSAGFVLSLLGLLGGPRAGSWRPAELEVAAPPGLMRFEQLREIAMLYLGRSYHRGGVGSPAFDCSGFTCRVFAEAGWPIPRVSRDQAKAGQAVPLQAIEPGDLLFFVDAPGQRRINHVGLYLGGQEMIHASSGQGEVKIDDLSRSWYQDRLVAARRILPTKSGLTIETSTSPPKIPLLPESPGLPEELLVSLEPQEHLPSEIPPWRSVPARIALPSFGPEMLDERITGMAVRSAAITEQGRLGAVVAPELRLWLESVTLEAAIAVPIRFEPKRDPSVGRLERAGDWLRFVDRLRFGQKNADLELGFSRAEEASLGEKLIVDHLAPATTASGIVGLSLRRTPLSFFGRYRGPLFELSALFDDVVDPAVLALEAKSPRLFERLALQGVLASDQRARRTEGGRRAITAAELSARFAIVEGERYDLAASVAGAVLSAEEEQGFGARLALDGQLRFDDSGVHSLSAGFSVLPQGRRFFAGFFGPTYLEARPIHLAALARAPDRLALEGQISLRLAKLVLGAVYADALPDGADRLDRRLLALIELRNLALFGRTLVDLRLAYAVRGAFGPRSMTADGLHGSLRIRPYSWFSFDLYLAEGDTLEGGAGATLSLSF